MQLYIYCTERNRELFETPKKRKPFVKYNLYLMGLFVLLFYVCKANKYTFHLKDLLFLKLSFSLLGYYNNLQLLYREIMGISLYREFLHTYLGNNSGGTVQ